MRSTATTLAAIALLAGALTQSSPTQAGPTDTPLPTFSDGKPALLVYTAAGVIKNNNLETDVACTNLDSVTRNIALQVFDETGALRNDLGAGTNGEFLNVGAGKTVTVGTAGTAVLHEDQTLTLNAGGSGANLLRNGSGRVVATSKNISCTAVVLDKLHTIQDPAVSSLPPPPLASVPLVKLP